MPIRVFYTGPAPAVPRSLIRGRPGNACAGEIKIVPEPAGTGGQDDLRYRAMQAPGGEGPYPAVASGRSSS